MSWFGKLAAIAVLALAMPATAQTKLPDLARWSEVALPGAPFTIDLPTELKTQPERVNGDTVNRSWTTSYGLMNIVINQTDRTSTKPYLGPRAFLEALGGKMLEKKAGKNATAEVTDISVIGYPAAKLVTESDTDNGKRIRIEEIMFTVGDDDWTISTTRYAGDSEDSDLVFKSIRAPAGAMPVLAPVTIGRMTIKAFGKPVTRENALPGDFAASTEYAFDFAGNTKAWIYHVRMRPGAAFSVMGAMQAQIDNVVGQSKPPVPDLVPFEDEVAGLPGSDVHGQAITGEGEECFRIVSVGEGEEGWIMLMAGPNNGRTEAIVREMFQSIAFAPKP